MLVHLLFHSLLKKSGNEFRSQRVEKENAVVIFAQNYIKFASFKTFHRNVLKGK